MRTVNLLITGQLRTPERIERSLKDWHALRDEGAVGRIVAVTWASEAAEHPDEIRRLESAGVELVVREDPRVRGIGHIWPQTLALDLGLREFNAGDVVLKTRTDLWMTPDLIRSLADPATLRLEASPMNRPGPLGARVWVPWFEISKPFYLADECFMGEAGDLKRLVNYDESYSLLHDIGCGITHIRRFMPVFRELSPLFERFLDRYTDAGHFSENRWTRMRMLLDDECYLDVLAAYYLTLAAWFRVGAPEGSIVFRSWSDGSPQPDACKPMLDAFSPARAALDPGGHVFAHGESWLHACVHDTLPADELGTRFQYALARARQSGAADHGARVA